MNLDLDWRNLEDKVIEIRKREIRVALALEIPDNNYYLIHPGWYDATITSLVYSEAQRRTNEFAN